MTPGATRLIWDRALNLTSSVMVSRNLPKGGTPWYSWNIDKVGVKHQSIKIRQKFKLKSLTPIGTHMMCFNRVWWEWSFFSRYCSRMFDESTLHLECTLILNINNRILLTIILSQITTNGCVPYALTSLTPPHCCTCLKPRPGFPTSCVVVFFYHYVDHHCLSFL